jgi:hypothetical protein
MHSDREQDVKKRAYEIWESEGRSEGSDMDHWVRAEQELDGAGNGEDQDGDTEIVNPRALREAAREHSDTYLVATDLEDDDQRTSSAGTREQE